MFKIKRLAKQLFSLLLIFSLGFLVACATPYQSLNEPTPEFYINDAAGALLQSTKWFVFSNGEKYYDDTTTDADVEDNIRGTQIVVATHLGPVGSIDTTAIFNHYGVGRNDLGIMIFLFYGETEETKVFTDIVIEIGTQMSTYLSAFEASQMVDAYFYDETLLGDHEAGLASLYYEFMELTAFRIYGWNPDYMYDAYLNLDDYLYEQFSFSRPLPSESSVWGFQLDTWQVFGLIILAVLLFGAGGRWFIPIILSMLGGSSNRGGGGQSGGYWFRK